MLLHVVHFKRRAKFERDRRTVGKQKLKSCFFRVENVEKRREKAFAFGYIYVYAVLILTF